MKNEFVGTERDFDFLVGQWQVAHRRLRRRHVGSDDWHEFSGVSRAWVLMGGVVNIDENHFPSEGFAGCTLRTLDLATRRWSIYWINSQSGILFPPVHGGFAGDRGEFYGDDVDNGRPVKVRYVWTKLGPDSARWEQAFALDGTTWETNWTMEFNRTAA
jgi:hypothetical protein